MWKDMPRHYQNSGHWKSRTGLIMRYVASLEFSDA